jgi:hypothetical protein
MNKGVTVTSKKIPVSRTKKKKSQTFSEKKYQKS